MEDVVLTLTWPEPGGSLTPSDGWGSISGVGQSGVDDLGWTVFKRFVHSEREMGIREGLDEVKPALMMVVVQIAYAGVNVFYKLAANDGMNLKIIIAYRFVFSTVFILPLAFFIERYHY
ncbi:hypothetical protein G4B88_022124 [Cannabis sativa]|uniref:WAT1-related protein n=1 Tax=Cannabis sativa TaxID=3483 RepID=A0A7J6FG96_CANSA|nr:hypothetical protein G4B88_022124 [Cannabis sativa]